MDRTGLPPGTELGGYQILAPLGAGGMGAVYRAQDGAGTQVALKLLHPSLSLDPGNRERLRREVAALQRLRHPAIARVLDAETDSTEAFIVTELVSGPTLDEHVRSNGPLDATQLADLAAGLEAALAYVHSQGVLHRDLKPANVMLTPSPVLIDFGIAQEEGATRVTSTGLVLGTPGYVAPELLGGDEPTTAADWWGFAAVLAYAATGRPPFGTGPLDGVLGRTQAGDPDLNGLPARTSLALASMLKADPAERAGAAEVVEQLSSVASGTQSTIALDAGAWANQGRTRTFAAPGTTAVMPLGATPPRPPVDAAPTTAMEPQEVAPTVEQVIPAPEPAEPAAAAPAAVAVPAVDDYQSPFDAPPAYVPPSPPRRTGTVLAFGLALTAAAALWPGIVLAIAILLTVGARTVGLDVAAVHARAIAKGGPEESRWRAVATSPWHALRALVTVLPAVIVAASITIIVGGTSWWALDTGRLTVVDGTNPPWVFSGALALAIGAGLVGLWFGPFSLTHRVGARWTLGAIAPGTSGGVVVWAVAVAVVAVVVMLVLSGHAITWWPLPGPPSLG